MPRPAVLLIACAAALACAPAGARAATCTSSIAGPNDPDFAAAERAPLSGATWNAEEWFLYDCMPQSAPAASDPEGAAGMSVNRAWEAFGRGNPGVIVAYMEGGVNWRRPDAPDLRRKAYLNTGELPMPQDASGTAHGTYDLDGDGVLTVDDYKDDPRVKHPFLHQDTAKGITSEDLIVAFSDGKDTDRNGYVDDISGWNFHRDTNDPQTDQSIYGHANGESRNLTAEADNHILGAGMCPDCRLLSVKMGDEAIDRPDRVAEAIVFAVDAGAQVIDVTTAALGQTRSMQKAVDYAYRRGVTIAWASNDFESSDHTEGMRLAHVWPGNSVVSDQSNRSDAARPNDLLAGTFRSRSSLTSYGAHALFSVSTGDGSTSAAIPITAGVAAMVHSASVDAAKAGQISSRLSADEVFQVTRATASPIDSTPCPNCFPGLPGAEWNLQYGYGRPNVFKAMDAVHKGDIPPEADVTAPYWYDEVDPTQTATLRVAAAVAARRSSSYRWELQYGMGPQPRDDQWTTIASGAGTKPAKVTGRLDLSKIPSTFWGGDYTAPTADRLAIERYDVSVRVRVTDAQGRLGEDRRVFQLRHDDTEVTALHKNLHTSLEPGATLADLEGTGRLDVIVGGADGTIHAFRPDGHEVPGWPVHTRPARGVDPRHVPNYLRTRAWRSGEVPRPREPLVAPLSVGDLDHDGGLDVVTCGEDGHLYAWDERGRLRRGFPLATDRSFERQAVPVPDTPYVRNASTGCVGGTALGDLEGNGKLDIVMGGWDGHVYAWRPNGAAVPGWPVSTDTPDSARHPSGADVYARDYKVATTPTLIDIDGDGRRDVVVALQDTAFGSSGSPVYGYIMGWNSAGKVLPHFPLTIDAAAQGYGTAQDFVTEGVQTPVSYTDGSTPKLIANAGLFLASTFDLTTGSGTQETPGNLGPEPPLQPPSPLVHFTSSASIGRVGDRPLTAVQEGSAAADVVGGVVAQPGLGLRVRSGMTAWDPSTGANLSQYVKPIQGLGFLTAPALADVTGDGKPDIVECADSGAMHGWDGTSGDPASTWPKWTGGWCVFTPAVGDLDADGKVEVISPIREGWLHVYRTPGKVTADDQAWHWHLNDRNTGHYGDDTRPPAGVRTLRVRRSHGHDTLTWSASGDDWNDGNASAYQVFRSRRPITQATLRRARRVPGTGEPQVAGQRLRLVVSAPHGRTYYAVRAVDDVGNLGPVRARGRSGRARG